MKDKHILFLASWYPSKVFPFSGDFVQRHAKAVGIYCRVTVLHSVQDNSLDEDYYVKDETKDGIREIIIRFRGTWFKPFNVVKRFLITKKIYASLGEVDLAHVHVAHPAGLFALYLKWFKDKNFVLTEHWTSYRQDMFRKIPLYKKLIIKQVLKNADFILPVSSDLANSISEVYKSSKIVVIPNVVEIQHFSYMDRKTSSIMKTKFLHLSSLNEHQKNIQGMLKVVNKLYKDGLRFEFHIGGNGSLEKIENFRKEHNLEDCIYTFTSIPYEKVGEKMNQYDCFVLFSNYETQSCVRLESFSTGLPFIGTDSGGISEFFPEDYGILIKKGDEKALYQAMKDVIDRNKTFADPEDMNKYILENFSQEVIAKKYIEVYQKVLKNEEN